MDKYLLIETMDNGEVTPELTAIKGSELMEIMPTVRAILNSNDPMPYEKHGHVDGFDKFVEYIPYNSDGMCEIKSIKVLTATDILI